MSWISTRSAIIAVNILSIFFLLGFGKTIGLDLTANIASSGITMAHWLAAGQGYILFAFYNRYI